MARNKQLISADGRPYTPWQRRTRALCILLLIWSLFELASAAGFITAFNVSGFDIGSVLPGLTVGQGTLVAGLINLVVSICGIIGAHNPKNITLFFWAVVANTVLLSWQVASNWSVGKIDPYTLVSFVVSFAFAICAWNVRGQTGYFDNHPYPEDEE